MNKHLVADIVEQYVIGALDADSVRFVEAHVAQCPPCAKLLQEEAAIEVALHEIVRRKKVVSIASRRRRIAAVVASAAAVLAAGLVLVFSLESEPPPSAQPKLRRCVERTTAIECISQGQFDGVITIGPNLEPIVPRYDVTPGTPGVGP
jgi:anti-sigma factor RsiW